MLKAFDRVRHVDMLIVLIEKLAAVGCGGTVLRRLADYLTGRTQQLVINDARGSSKPCSGVCHKGQYLALFFSVCMCVRYQGFLSIVFHCNTRTIYLSE